MTPCTLTIMPYWLQVFYAATCAAVLIFAGVLVMALRSDQGGRPG